MKKLALAVSMLALSAMSATAADMAPRYTKAPVVPVEPGFSWTGFYVGVNAGYADPTAGFGVVPGGSWIGDPDVPFTSATSPGVVNAGTRNLPLRGFTGGGQIGYNWQVNSWVLGIEADANYLGLKNSYGTPTYNGVAGGTYSASGSVALDAFYTIRGRLGFAADHWLFFVTGGLAVTSEKFSQSINFINPTIIITLPPTGFAGGANAGSASSTAASWTVGGGTEYALNKQWSIKGEYLYVKLPSMSFSSAYGPNGFTGGTWTMQHNLSLSGLNIFRAGLNYHF